MYFCYFYWIPAPFLLRQNTSRIRNKAVETRFDFQALHHRFGHTDEALASTLSYLALVTVPLIAIPLVTMPVQAHGRSAGKYIRLKYISP